MEDESLSTIIFLVDIGWQDVTKLTKDGRTRSLADQLYRSLGSICANNAEGYSRGTSRDRARFYENALDYGTKNDEKTLGELENMLGLPDDIPLP